MPHGTSVPLLAVLQPYYKLDEAVKPVVSQSDSAQPSLVNLRQKTG